MKSHFGSKKLDIVRCVRCSNNVFAENCQLVKYRHDDIIVSIMDPIISNKHTAEFHPNAILCLF